MNHNAKTREVLYEKFSIKKSTVSFLLSLLDDSDIYYVEYGIQDLYYYIKNNSIIMVVRIKYDSHKYRTIKLSINTVYVLETVHNNIKISPSFRSASEFDIIFTTKLHDIISKEHDIRLDDDIVNTVFDLVPQKINRILEEYRISKKDSYKK
jgi:hypothetical protein